ncbi:uncharacterized protein LOC110989800 [Acanthaster planci]|uniref:Uncharacterized protein LOC110989800 n=1 Tax=Acanthaster planci TaxID=133434 RepID=A0A8B7ZYG1_ACAPL|nr:uncharacterized protein LOC110989800 [Acanthaster planci]
MADDEEQVSSDDQDPDLTDFHSYVPRKSYRSIPDSYSYRLTHDISLDNFQSQDLFDTQNDLGTQGDWSYATDNKPAKAETKPTKERHDSNGSTDKLLNEDMIKLDLSDSNVLSERLSGDAATTTLLNIIEAETLRRNSQTTIKTDDSDSGRKVLRQKRKTKRKGRKLPQMPPAKPGNLQMELLQADRRPANSTSSARSSTPSPDHPDVSLSSVPPSPSDDNTSALPDTPVEPYALRLPQPQPQRPTRLEFNTTSAHYTPFLTNTNMLLQEDSSPEERQRRRLRLKMENMSKEEPGDKSGDEEKSCFQPAMLVINGEIKQQTHIAVFRFLPRHEDELPLEVSDPIFVEFKCEDLWYEGINLKTGEEGCFPSRYVRDFTADTESIPGFRGRKVHINRYNAKFLGSVEVAFHKGNDVLCRAMQKVVTARRLTVDIHPPTLCVLEISDIGVKMIDKAKPQKAKEKKDSVLKKVEKLLGSKQNKGHNYFFSLKNISFCGYHPSSNRYFAFITKHPSDGRYACHVFVMEDGLSAKPVAEAMGAAFRRFYSEFLDFTNPTEDIYME